jgi:hypothetical protein
MRRIRAAPTKYKKAIDTYGEFRKVEQVYASARRQAKKNKQSC